MTKMLLSRRSTLIGLSALAAAPAFAQTRFEAAKAYSTARRGISFLVMQRGQVLVEDYQGLGLRFKGWELASGTKSFSGVMAAALVQDGLLKLDEYCADTLPEFLSDRYRSAIRVNDLLHLVSGIDGKGGRRFGDVPTYAEALAAPSNSVMGSQFSYGPVPFQVFGELARRKLVAAKTGDADPLAYLTRRLFTPLGIRPIRWQRGSDGMPHLPSGAAITARDWAKFGQFVLAGGVHEGKALVDPVALKANFEASKANPGYGLTWWMPRPGMIGPGPRSGVAGEAVSLSGLGKLYMAAGAGNQRLYLLPEQDMVIVRQADGIAQSLRGGAGDWSDQKFLSLILGA
ncbi:serine hydrolase domain-containing protein [Aquidulcibacter sp.]|uniref:serine hydrolase domain-containing protein n=1 Tax=Aquidulcibacter sp. TaxID=2052990 RepID=UPI0037C0C575